jgi:hypothetical protein
MNKIKRYFKLYNYQNKFLGLLSTIFQKKLTKYENKVLEDVKFSSDYSPIFIVGAPRTGSTILFEKLTNELDILYPNNLSWKFYNNFLFSFILSNKIYKNKAHNCFDSVHGGTLGCGWNAPSECGTFWRKWIDIDNKIFYDKDDLTKEEKDDIKKDILSVINYFDKPLLFKNLVNGQMIRLLLDIFPNAKFIFVKRDILLTAQSILKAKRKNGMKDNEYWSIKPKNYQELKEIKNPYEQIIKQIYYIEKQILDDSKLIPKDNFLIVNYENLEKDLVKAKKFIGVQERKNYKKYKPYISNKISLKDEEIKSLKSEIDRVNML